eukprot:1176288-Prorocentrum_minimum.AAC.1
MQLSSRVVNKATNVPLPLTLTASSKHPPASWTSTTVKLICPSRRCESGQPHLRLPMRHVGRIDAAAVKSTNPR